MTDPHMVRIKCAYAAGHDNALAVREQISENLKTATPVIVDFTGVEVVTPSFLSVAIASLLEDYPADFLNKMLTVDNIGLNAFALRQAIALYRQMLEAREGKS